MKILILFKKNSGVDYHRLLLPNSFLPLSQGDLIITVSNQTSFNPTLLHDVDIVLYSRECPYSLNALWRFKAEYGFKVVVDIDDYWKLYPQHYLYETWKKNKTEEAILSSIRIADALTTTNKLLATALEEYEKPTHIFPNAIPFGQDQFRLQETLVVNSNLLYVAGASHLHDLKSISYGLSMCKNNPYIQDFFDFVVCGYNATNTDSKKHWDQIMAAANNFGEADYMITKPLISYMDFYNNGLLCIAPLQSNKFNTYKSNLKILEAGCKKLPIIVSALPPYTEDDVQGVTICKTQKDWYFAILKYAKNPEKLIEDGEALYKYVKTNYELTDVSKKRYEFYKNLIKD